MCSEKEENQREGQGPQAYLWDTNMRFRFKWNNPGEDRITWVSRHSCSKCGHRHFCFCKDVGSSSGRRWPCSKGQPCHHRLITLIQGSQVCRPRLFLESKGIAGLGLGLETFRHLLEVWKRTLEDASVFLIFVLSTWRGTQIG